MDSLFGVPFYHSSIDPSSYSKGKIVESIKSNWEVDPYRNEWDGKKDFGSVLHHESQDRGNERFEKIDYSSLAPIYNRHISSFIDGFHFPKDVTANFAIVNYTCMQSNNFMKEHLHSDYFSGVHYIKFDKKTHPPTHYSNAGQHPAFMQFLNPIFFQNLDKSVDNSWLHETFSLDIEEDDIVIIPAALKHFVPPFVSDELRMTIVFNIRLSKE
jgi:hypothetical protein